MRDSKMASLTVDDWKQCIGSRIHCMQSSCAKGEIQFLSAHAPVPLCLVPGLFQVVVGAKKISELRKVGRCILEGTNMDSNTEAFFLRDLTPLITQRQSQHSSTCCCAKSCSTGLFKPVMYPAFSNTGRWPLTEPPPWNFLPSPLKDTLWNILHSAVIELTSSDRKRTLQHLFEKAATLNQLYQGVTSSSRWG